MRWLLVLVWLAGCNALFDVHSAVQGDRDSDRVPDALDNCPDSYNPDQSDVDRNEIGDACDHCNATDPTDSDGDSIPDACDDCDNRTPDQNHDGVPDDCERMDDGCPNCRPCALGPAHDEDGDTFADACDVCPAIADPTQADTAEIPASGGNGGGDGVGDACDRGPSSDIQQFDPFTDHSSLWYVFGPHWAIGADQATLAFQPAVEYRMAGVARDSFVVSTRFDETHPGYVVVFASSGLSPPGSEYSKCEIGWQVSPAPGVDQVNVLVATAAGSNGATSRLVQFDGTPPIEVRLKYEISKLTCTLQATGGQEVSLTVSGDSLPSWYPGFGGNGYGGGAVHFDYYDVVTNR